MPWMSIPSKNQGFRALSGVAQWIECQPVNQKVTSLITGHGTCLAGGSGSWGYVRGN